MPVGGESGAIDRRASLFIGLSMAAAASVCKRARGENPPSCRTGWRTFNDLPRLTAPAYT